MHTRKIEQWLGWVVQAIVLIGLLLGVAWCAKADEPQDHRYLMSWAVRLSQYEAPARLPGVRFVPHQYFVDRVCSGRAKCPVRALYPGGDVVLISDEYVADSPTHRGLIVHEFVHYLQKRAGAFSGLGCVGKIDLEREAYAVQREYLALNHTFKGDAGVANVIGLMPNCGRW